MTIRISRRDFGRSLGTAAIASVALPPAALASAEPIHPAASNGAFPKGFLWGAATAAYQVEGGVHEAGRGPSIWDTFSHLPGKIENGDTGDQADDFLHHYDADIQLMSTLGLRAFRFSVSWTRVFPTGTGKPNPKGLDFYRKLVADLQHAGIQPFCTLYHWDLPQALQDRGGWENPDMARYLADYAGYVAGELSRDGVKHFFTTNEIRTFVELGYGQGTHAPGLKVGRKRLAQLTHNVLLGHGLSVQAIRARALPGTQVSLAENPTAAVPVTLAEADIHAARVAMREENAPYLTAILEGRYTDRYLAMLGKDAPHFTPEEMRIISSPLDAVGLNIYTATYVRASSSAKEYEILPLPADFPHVASSWLSVSPECLAWGPRLINELWHPKALYITENGSSADDKFSSDGEVLDLGRIMYLRNCLSQLQRVIEVGVPVRGYFAWSLLDNFEWADGYGKRFGLVYVDFNTQKRTPKLSAQFYRSVIERNAI
jgi:beta-glucosidase